MRDRFHAAQHDTPTDYGLRTPEMVEHLTIAGFASFFASGLFRYIFGTPKLADLMFAIGTFLTLPAMAVKIGIALIQNTRMRARDTLVNSIPWRGDENVLDVGCGGGILLFACAKRLSTGKGIGIDIWDINAGGGTPERFWYNAQAEGVTNCIDLQNVNAAQMPFEDGKFDVVTSSLAIHHMGHDTHQALQEMNRVLKPGGYLALFDVERVLKDVEPAFLQQNYRLVHRSGNVFRVLVMQKGAA